MTGKDDVTVTDFEEIVDDSLQEIESRIRRYTIERLDRSIEKLTQMERELDEFLLSAPEYQESTAR